MKPEIESRRSPTGFISGDPRTRLQPEGSTSLHYLYILIGRLGLNLERGEIAGGAVEEVGSGSIRLIYLNLKLEALICQSHTASSCCVSRKIMTITPLEDIPCKETRTVEYGNYPLGGRVFWEGKCCGVGSSVRVRFGSSGVQ